MKNRFKLSLLCTLVLPLLAASSLQAQDEAVARGNSKFQHSCAPCHGKGVGDDGRAFLPGTDALRVKYQGATPAALEERTDLPADVLMVYLRKGSWSMPPFRKTELTDNEIADIAAYLKSASSQTR